MDDITATLYRVVKCQYLDEETGKHFSNLSSVIVDLKAWIDNLASVGETCTYEPSQDGSLFRTFCFDIRKLNAVEAYLIVTWNEVSDAEEGVQLISSDAAVGEAEVSTVAIDALALPGYPAFFVLFPEDGSLLNIRFEQRLNGMQNFKRYIGGFMQESAKWCVWEGNDRLVGYAEDEKNVTGNYQPFFETVMRRRLGNLDWFRREVGNIRQIVHRKLVKPTLEPHKLFLDKALTFLGLKPNNRLKADIDFEYRFKIRLTPEKLEQIIAEYETITDKDGWTDVAFIMAKDGQKKHWLSGSICREKMSVSVRRSKAGMVDVDHLVELLDENVEKFLQRLS